MGCTTNKNGCSTTGLKKVTASLVRVAPIEVPGCSLCMGNQARVADGATVVSTSTRKLPESFRYGANVHHASAEFAAVASLLGRYQSHKSIFDFINKVDETAEDTLPSYPQF